jgi:hypothetical protein
MMIIIKKNLGFIKKNLLVILMELLFIKIKIMKEGKIILDVVVDVLCKIIFF